MQLPDADRRADEDLRGDVLEALMLDVPVPMTIDAKARDSFVTLIGTLAAQYLAAECAWRCLLAECPPWLRSCPQSPTRFVRRGPDAAS